MKKLIILCLIFLAGDILPQTMPSGYTTNYRFRKWSQSAVPTADSLNANWDAIDAAIKVALDSADASTRIKTWGNQTMYGQKTFNDPVYLNDLTYNYLIRPPDTTFVSAVGTSGYPYKKVYSKDFVLINGTDSAYITYDGNNFVFDKNISADTFKVTKEFTLPDSAKLGGYTLSEKPYSFTLTTDSIISITSDPSPSSIVFIGLTSASGVDSIDMPKAGDGQVLTITNNTAFTRVLQDSYPSDGNLNLASDFSMGIDDVITLKYNSAKHEWVECSRSNN